MAEAAVSMAVAKLGSLAIQKVSSLRNVEAQVEQLKEELINMQQFLKYGMEKQTRDKRVRRWISDINEVAFDAEDVIESFTLSVDEPRKMRGLLETCVCFPEHLYNLNKLRPKIKSIQEKLKDIDQRRERYGIQRLDEAPMVPLDTSEWRRRVSPWHKGKHVVGLEKHIETLLQKGIFMTRFRLFITSIVGMGGVGKSTLAREVYNRKDVGKQFECCAWVTVSRDFSPRGVLKELFQQLTPVEAEHTSVESLSESSMERMIYNHLRHKRYFIVLDDVWRQEDWECIARAFPDYGAGSRLLITSRSDNIVNLNIAYVHKLECLNPIESWQLFLTASKCPEELVDIGKKIVQKCHGLPLAINVMAGLLLEQRESLISWERVCKGMESHLEAGNDSLNSVLELSYSDLPPHLKCCFLFLNFYREDALIDARAVIQLWIAQDIIPKGKGKVTMEETAQSYLDELINRNMIQTIKLSKDGQVKSCQIHNLLRDLSLVVAMDEINYVILNNEDSTSQSLGKARHLAFYYNNESFASLRSSNPHLRSVFLRPSTHGNECIPLSFWEILDGCIKVLELGDLGLTTVHKRIGTLNGLKYLGLSNNQIGKLPRSLGHLYHLQTLNISGNTNLDVPNVIWKLDSLRHLFMPRNIICKKPLKLDTLKNLQTLCDVSTKNIVVEHLSKMVSLHELKLELTIDVDVNELLTLLATLENLVHLGLSWRSKHVLSLDGIANLEHLRLLHIFGKLVELPKSFPEKLSYLKLSYTKLSEDPMPILGRLPNLSRLKFFLGSYVGKEMNIVSNGFPSLEVLSLVYLPNLRQMSIGNGGPPKLKELKILYCRYLNIIPEEEEIRMKWNLQKLKISDTSKTASYVRATMKAALSLAEAKLRDLAITISLHKAVFSRLKVDEKVTNLVYELRAMEPYLLDAVEKEAYDESIHAWISNIREVAVDAADVVESFDLQVNAPRKQVYGVYMLGQDIESIQKRVDDISKEGKKLGIRNLYDIDMVSKPPTSRSVDTHSSVASRSVDTHSSDEDVIVLDEHVETIP